MTSRGGGDRLLTTATVRGCLRRMAFCVLPRVTRPQLALPVWPGLLAIALCCIDFGHVAWGLASAAYESLTDALTERPMREHVYSRTSSVDGGPQRVGDKRKGLVNGLRERRLAAGHPVRAL